ncbi:MAG: BrnT family toxin, partial [Clostridia bacterium]|nr:BrnT family toxin [Clostridia bacterium]
DRIEIYDEEHSGEEDRYDTIGQALKRESGGTGMKLTLGKVHGLLFVVYTDRIILGRERIRLISARLATKFEEMLYLNNSF